ncbi:hypothetical protein FACS189487_00750 [Campylobacterota bacterium]|nr:hypothetical protein FACS189487_00750 [Campylobacterota bacterium]
MFVFKVGEVRAVRQKPLTDKATGEVRNEVFITLETLFVDGEGDDRIDVAEYRFPIDCLNGQLLTSRGKYLGVVCEYTNSFFNRSTNVYYDSSLRQVVNAVPIVFDHNPFGFVDGASSPKKSKNKGLENENIV